MFSEDVVLGALKAGASWFISDHLLRMDSPAGSAEEVAAEIANRNDLRYERAEQEGRPALDSGESNDGQLGLPPVDDSATHDVVLVTTISTDKKSDESREEPFVSTRVGIRGICNSTSRNTSRRPDRSIHRDVVGVRKFEVHFANVLSINFPPFCSSKAVLLIANELVIGRIEERAADIPRAFTVMSWSRSIRFTSLQSPFAWAIAQDARSERKPNTASRVRIAARV